MLEKESILDVKFLSESPDDSNARATDLGILSLKLKEKFRQLQMEMPKMIQERLLNGH